MNSDDEDFKDFEGWVAFKNDNLYKIPDKSGVYILINGKEISRLNGKSDILKIGITKSRGLSERLMDYLDYSYYKKYEKPSKEKVTYWKVVRAMIGLDLNVKVAWKEETDYEERKKLQRKLLLRYEDDHYEFPPLNTGVC